MRSFFVGLGILSWLSEVVDVKGNDGIADYGVDVVSSRQSTWSRSFAGCRGANTSILQSFPMHHANVTYNYDWMPWNTDPSVPTPDEYSGMPVQPLGDRQSFYEGLIQGCKDFYGAKRGSTCRLNEKERIQMSLRQPKVSTRRLLYKKIFRDVHSPHRDFDNRAW
jgi:hypothetical protein